MSIQEIQKMRTSNAVDLKRSCHEEMVAREREDSIFNPIVTLLRGDYPVLTIQGQNPQDLAAFSSVCIAAFDADVFSEVMDASVYLGDNPNEIYERYDRISDAIKAGEPGAVDAVAVFTFTRDGEILGSYVPYVETETEIRFDEEQQHIGTYEDDSPPGLGGRTADAVRQGFALDTYGAKVASEAGLRELYRQLVWANGLDPDNELHTQATMDMMILSSILKSRPAGSFIIGYIGPGHGITDDEALMAYISSEMNMIARDIDAEHVHWVDGEIVDE